MANSGTGESVVERVVRILATFDRDLVPAGVWDEVPMQLRVALRNGLTRKEPCGDHPAGGLYRGVPVANHGFTVLTVTLGDEAGGDPAGSKDGV